MKRLLSALTLSSILIPQFAVSQGACALSAQDTVAGLGTEIRAMQCTPGLLEVSITAPNAATQTMTMNIAQTGEGVLPVNSTATQIAGSYTVRSALSATAFSVLPDLPDQRTSELTASKSTLTPDGTDSVAVTLRLRDRFGNPLSGRPVVLFSSRDRDMASARGRETDVRGEMTWDISTDQPGSLTLTAYDILSTVPVAQRLTLNAGQTGFTSQQYMPSPYAAALTGFESGGEFGPIARFEVRISGGGTAMANDDLTIVITAVDAQGTVVENYAGDIRISSSDAGAILPSGGMTRFQQYELGVKSIQLGLRFRTPGQQTVTVTDSANPSITGSATVAVSTSGGTTEGDIVILDPPNRSSVSSTSVLVQGRAPSFVNLRIKGGMQEVSTVSDAEGVFRVTVPLNPAQRDHTLFVVSDNGRYESAAHTLILDTAAPGVEKVTFEPTVGKAGDKATITVRTEPSLRKVEAQVESALVSLTETMSGTYMAEFIAPEAGTHSIKVTTMDASGNEGVMMAQWDTEGSGITQVQNVTAEGRPNAVLVNWQAPEGDDIAQFRIYIGDSPTNYAYGLETGRPVASALVNGLEPGKTYFIAVTALDAEGKESEKSVPVSATPIGMRLAATAGNESLQLNWQPPAGTTLNSYILEYGVEPNVYTEKRSISGELRTFILRDLLNGVTYELKLTPVTVTGQAIPELAGIVRGTPNGSGFHPGAPDQVPPDIYDPTQPDDPWIEPDHIPNTPDSGLPAFAIWTIVTVTVGGGIFFAMKRRQKLLTQQFMQAMQHQYDTRR